MATIAVSVNANVTPTMIHKINIIPITLLRLSSLRAYGMYWMLLI